MLLAAWYRQQNGGHGLAHVFADIRGDITFLFCRGARRLTLPPTLSSAISLLAIRYYNAGDVILGLLGVAGVVVYCAGGDVRSEVRRVTDTNVDRLHLGDNEDDECNSLTLRGELRVLPRVPRPSKLMSFLEGSEHWNPCVTAVSLASKKSIHSWTGEILKSSFHSSSAEELLKTGIGKQQPQHQSLSASLLGPPGLNNEGEDLDNGSTLLPVIALTRQLRDRKYRYFLFFREIRWLRYIYIELAVSASIGFLNGFVLGEPVICAFQLVAMALLFLILLVVQVVSQPYMAMFNLIALVIVNLLSFLCALLSLIGLYWADDSILHTATILATLVGIIGTVQGIPSMIQVVLALPGALRRLVRHWRGSRTDRKPSSTAGSTRNQQPVILIDAGGTAATTAISVCTCPRFLHEREKYQHQQHRLPDRQVPAAAAPPPVPNISFHSSTTNNSSFHPLTMALTVCL